jgi:N-acyl-D-aspartate/D-glutamate deacylase
VSCATDPGGLVIIDLLSEDDPADRALLLRSLTFPGAIVASDAMPVTWTEPPADPQAWPLPPAAITHPRTAGTFSRALRLLTREGQQGGEGAVARKGSPPRGGLLSLGQALAKCSLEPARLLQDRVPALRGKGRLRPGGDADIVVFDPVTITDQASYRHSTRPAAGIRHVLVNGEFVVRDGDIVSGARPGGPVRAEPR